MSRPEQLPGSLADEVEKHRMPLLEHLRELRYRIMVSIGALAVGMIGGFIFASDIYDLLRAPIQAVFNDKPHNRMDEFYLWLTSPLTHFMPVQHVVGSLNNSSGPLEGMYSYFQVGLITGVVAASPVIAFQLWQFVAPGLYSSEKKYVIPLTIASTGLFLLGAFFCYAVIFPLSFPFFLTVIDATNVISVQGYIDASVRMMIGFGASFQLPVVVWFLARLGIIDHRDMIKFFRYAVVCIFLAAAIITPGTDPLSQSLMAVPLLVLYISGIAVAFFATTKKRDVPEVPTEAT